MEYSPNSGYDATKAYRKGAVVSYASNIYIANDFIPPGTTLTFGTSGATWKAAPGSGELFSAGVTATAAARYGPTSFVSTHANFKAPQKIEIVSFKFGSNESNSTGLAQIGLFSFDASTLKLVGGNTQVETITRNVVQEIFLNVPLVVDSGKYVGLHVFSSPLNGGCVSYATPPANANSYYVQGGSSLPGTTDAWTQGSSNFAPNFSFMYKKV